MILLTEDNLVFLVLRFDNSLAKGEERVLVSTDNFGIAVVSNFQFENADESKLLIKKA